MSTATVILIIVAVAAIGLITWRYMQKQRTQRLRSRFGPEYDHVANEFGNARKAEAELANREQRVGKFSIRDLRPAECERYAEAWRAEQARFVDNPKETVSNADRIVGDLMKEKGYPVGDFEQRAADISVDHPQVVVDYRAAHEIALLDGRGQATTEDLRKAMIHFRSLFEDLLGRHVHELEEVRR